MPFAFSDLREEVKRRATKNQGGTQFDTGIKNVINTSIFRIAREARWRSLRRTATFNTVTSYSTGTGAVTVTANSANVTVTGATFITNNITKGRYITFNGNNTIFKIASITGETTLTLDAVYNGTTSTTAKYSIYPQEEYTLPIQVGHSAFFWHRAYGYPTQMQYIPTQEFYNSSTYDLITSIPLSYKMWGMDSTIEQPLNTSVVTISSSSTSDTSISVTVFGIVSGYPDYEIIVTNGSDGTTAVPGLKSFSSIERITKNQSTIGRITCTTDTGNTTVGVLLVGNTTTGPYYTKIQLYPLPNQVIPINCFYYKIPYQLVNDGDVSEIGEDFSEAIILLSTAKMKAEQNMKEDRDFFQMYADEISSLKKTNVDKVDWNPTLKRSGKGNNHNGIINPLQVGSGGFYGWRSY